MKRSVRKKKAPIGLQRVSDESRPRSCSEGEASGQKAPHAAIVTSYAVHISVHLDGATGRPPDAAGETKGRVAAEFRALERGRYAAPADVCTSAHPLRLPPLSGCARRRRHSCHTKPRVFSHRRILSLILIILVCAEGITILCPVLREAVRSVRALEEEIVRFIR